MSGSSSCAPQPLALSPCEHTRIRPLFRPMLFWQLRSSFWSALQQLFQQVALLHSRTSHRIGSCWAHLVQAPSRGSGTTSLLLGCNPRLRRLFGGRNGHVTQRRSIQDVHQLVQLVVALLQTCSNPPAMSHEEVRRSTGSAAQLLKQKRPQRGLVNISDLRTLHSCCIFRALLLASAPSASVVYSDSRRLSVSGADFDDIVAQCSSNESPIPSIITCTSSFV